MPYTFTAEDFDKFTTDVIGAEGDQASLTTILSDMQSVYIDAIAESLTNKDEMDKIKSENERLKEANREFFLRIGAQNRSKLPNEPERREEQEDKNIDAYLADYFKEDK